MYLLCGQSVVLKKRCTPVIVYIKGVTNMNFDEEIKLKQSREYKIIKKNDIIQNVTKRKYELSMMEQKILGYIISMIKPMEITQKQPIYSYEFDILNFCQICGIDFKSGRNYENVRNGLKKLADNSFWIQDGDDELLFQWITTPRIRKKDGTIIVKISDDVMPYLCELQNNFTEYELYQILALKHSYSIGLYELMKSYAYRKHIVITIEEIKKYFSIENKYTEYKNFRRKIIEPAIEEINEYTDLNVQWQPVRKGRNYHAIEFYISSKPQTQKNNAYIKVINALDRGTE